MTEKQYKLTILVPIYNEVDNLQRLEEELKNYLQKSVVPTKVLFINDGSTDGSGERLREICARNEAFSSITLGKNSGLSAALKAGFDKTETELTGYMDADLQTSPEDFNVLLQNLEDCALVTGVRANRKDSFTKNLSSKIANGIRRAFTHDGMDDTGCPLKIIRSEYAKQIPMFKGLHRFLPAMVLLQEGKIKQVPVRHFPRVAGESKYGFWNRLIGPLLDCFVYVWMKKKYIRYTIVEENE